MADSEDASADRPRPDTIRRLPTTAPELSTWIAESTSGGICVLLSPNRKIRGTYVTGATCTPDASGRTEGTYLSYGYPESSEVALAGVVPIGVSSVAATFSDGTRESVPVQEGGWALTSTRTPVSITALPGGTPAEIGGE